MSCDYMSHRVSIGIFYSRVYSIVRKKMFFMTKFKPFCCNLNLLFHTFCNLVVHIVLNYLFKSFYTNLCFTLILLILILLDNDIAENPGPFSDEISIFHVNARSVRNKLDYVESVGFDSSLICITERSTTWWALWIFYRILKTCVQREIILIYWYTSGFKNVNILHVYQKKCTDSTDYFDSSGGKIQNSHTYSTVL